MVTRDDMLATTPGPSRVMRFVYWRATPTAINGIASVEDELEQVRDIIRKSPAATLAFAFALGSFLAHRARRH